MDQNMISRQREILNHEMKVLKDLIKKRKQLEKIYLSIVRDDESTLKIQIIYNIAIINGEFHPVTFRIIDKFNPKRKANLASMMIDYKLNGNLVTSNHIVNINNLPDGSYSLTAHIKSIRSAPTTYVRFTE